VVALSEVLNALPIHPPDVRSAKFRNPAGVNTKLANLRWVDPEIEGGLSRGAKLDQVVWDMFAHDPDRLRQVAEAIRQNGALAEVVAAANQLDEEAPEGQVLRAYTVRERNRGLVQRRTALAIKQQGRLAREACGACGLRSAMR
jgi:5-methylcytosine-specific restriction protein A